MKVTQVARCQYAGAQTSTKTGVRLLHKDHHAVLQGKFPSEYTEFLCMSVSTFIFFPFLPHQYFSCHQASFRRVLVYLSAVSNSICFHVFATSRSRNSNITGFSSSRRKPRSTSLLSGNSTSWNYSHLTMSFDIR